MDGGPFAVVRAGNTIYLGGSSLNGVARPTPGWIAIPPGGSVDTALPDLGGPGITDMAPDGKGGWYVAGDFGRLGGRSLAHVRADRTIDQDWTPDIDHATGNGVGRIFVGPDGTVYVFGRFEDVNGESRHRIAALDPVTGRVLPWNPQSNGAISDLAFGADGTVYIAGGFTQIGANHAARSYIAALDPHTADAKPWDPSATPQAKNDYPSGVKTLVVAPDGTVYAGGYFTTIGANHATRNNLAALDPTTGNATAWSPNPDWVVHQVVRAASGTIYLTGGFTAIGANAASRRYIAALDPVSGNATSWDPNPDSWTNKLALAPDGTIYVTGSFKTIGANHAARRSIAQLDPTTGNASAWDIHAMEAGALAFAPDGTLYASVDAIDLQPRHGLAALDATTGMLRPWAPSVDGYVFTMAVGSDDTVYVGGQFTHIGTTSVARRNLAALDPSTGEATSWDPSPNREVYALAPKSGGPLFVSGAFTTIGSNSQSRTGLAAIDATGQATTWNPAPTATLLSPIIQALALAPDEKVLYVGGDFDTIGSVPTTRNGVAALDPATAAATAWNPNARRSDGSRASVVVFAFAPTPDHSVYLAGSFATIGANNAARHNLAALAPDPGVANATSWNPNPIDPYEPVSSPVISLATSPDGTVYAGGSFTTIGANSAPRTYLAALDPLSANATPFDPQMQGVAVHSLLTNADNELFAGGGFVATAYSRQQGWARFGPPAPPVIKEMPHISGTPQVDSALTCTSGFWNGGQVQTYTYQWLRDGTALPAATANSYTAIDADGGHALSCRVSATNVAGAASVDTSTVSIPVRQQTSGGSGGGSGGGNPGGSSTPLGSTGAPPDPSAPFQPRCCTPQRPLLGVLTLPSGRARVGRGGVVVLTATCRAHPCRGLLALTATPASGLRQTARRPAPVLAQARFSLRPGQASRILLRLNPTGRRLLRAGHGSMRTTLKATIGGRLLTRPLSLFAP
jgi:WD40 repeat protein